MNFIFSIVVSLFIIFNVIIVGFDIIYRRIPNSLILILIIIIPFWYYIFPIGRSDQVFLEVLLSTMLIVFGVFLYQKNGFLGSGDVKYAAVLILFLGEHSIRLFIANIGILTLITLVFWWSLILGQIYALRGHMTSPWNSYFSAKKSKESILQSILLFFLDWAIIGFLLSLIIAPISARIFEIVPNRGDLYFFLSIIIFLLRPSIRYLITQWRHRLFPILLIGMYFGTYISNNNMDIFIYEFHSYISYMWIYAFAFSLVQYITSTTFGIYDTLVTKNKIYSMIHTLPYSLVIFLGFCLIYFWDMNLMKSIFIYD